MKENQKYAEILSRTVGLHASPVGVRFVETSTAQNAEQDYRFCQAVMQARKGQNVTITKDHITCPAAAAALGFKQLPPNLQDGSMLCGYGIFKEKSAGMHVMNTMPRLELGRYTAVEIKPLDAFDSCPDVVIIEDEPEKLMWIALAYLNENGGRLEFSTSILQAVCVDSAVLPFLNQKINMSFGCYGCRDATDAQTNEALLGFPGSKLPVVTANLEYLQNQAIPRSRAKNVYQAFVNRKA